MKTAMIVIGIDWGLAKAMSFGGARPHSGPMVKHPVAFEVRQVKHWQQQRGRRSNEASVIPLLRDKLRRMALAEDCQATAEQ